MKTHGTVAGPDRIEEEWVYLGRRFNGSRRKPNVEYLWRDGRGLTVTQTDREMAARVVGAVYAVLVWRRPGEEARVVAPPRFLRHDAEDSSVAGWTLLDNAAIGAFEQARAESRAARTSRKSLDLLTLGELRAELHRAPSPAKTAILATTLVYLGVGVGGQAVGGGS